MARKKKRRTTKRRGKGSADGSRAATVAWAAGHLRKQPEISMSELKRLGRSEGHHVYPLIIGLARKKLGWSQPKKKAKRRGRKKAPGRGPGRPSKAASGRRPGRPRANADPSALLGDVVNRMRDLERENERLRKAMDRIADLAGGA